MGWFTASSLGEGTLLFCTGLPYGLVFWKLRGATLDRHSLRFAMAVTTSFLLLALPIAGLFIVDPPPKDMRIAMIVICVALVGYLWLGRTLYLRAPANLPQRYALFQAALQVIAWIATFVVILGFAVNLTLRMDRGYGVEASAVGTLRMINTAENTYSSDYKRGYNSSLSALGPPNNGDCENPSTEHACMLD